MTRVTVAMVGLSFVGLALVAVLTAVPEPERVRAETPPDVMVVRDGSELLRTDAGREDVLGWVNAFPSEVAGPVEGPLRIETEAAPSPLSWGATLVRVTVQASRTAATVPAFAEARVMFFGSETTGFRPQTDSRWYDPGVPLRAQLTGLTTGATRSFFIEVDQSLRWGGSLGVVTLIDANGRELVVPIERGRSLDRASADFRFSTAVLIMTHPNAHRGELETLAQALVADTAPGVPWREEFVERFVPAAPEATFHSTGVFKEFSFFQHNNDTY